MIPAESSDIPMDDNIPTESMDVFFDCAQDTPCATEDIPMDDIVPMESMDDLRDYYRNIEMTQLKADLCQAREPSASFREKQSGIAQQLTKKAFAYSQIAQQLVKLFDFMRLDKTLYLRVCAVWRKIGREDIPDLYEGLPHEIADGLNDVAAKEIYKKIYQNQSIRISSEDLIENPNLIALRDGVYDIENDRIYESGRIPDSFLCLNASVKEIGKGPVVAYDNFLTSTFSNSEAAIMRFEETQGAILTTYPLKSIFFYMGNRDSGKSVIEKLDMELLKNTSGIGDEYQHIMPLDNINRLSKQFGLGDAPDKWLIVCGDAAKVAVSENTTAILKQLSGNDYIRGELKHVNAQGGFFKGRILLLSNHPLHGAIDDALKSRIIMTPFLASIPKENQIPDLHRVLYEERGQILHHFFRAMRRLLDRNFNYTPIEEQEAWVSKSGVSVQDTVEAFIAERTVRDTNARTDTQSLFSAYKNFCEALHYTALTDSGVFGRFLQASCPWAERYHTASERGFCGIMLK